jgi:tetratricopeptide (TPR) repeat protein
MYNLIPLILILVSLTVIIFVITKKFAVLANIDIDSIQKEKEAKIKEEIVSNRLKRNFLKWSSKLVKATKFLGGKTVVLSRWAYNRLHDMRDNYKKDTEVVSEEKEAVVENAMDEVRELQKNEDWKEAEKKLIKIISLDSQNVEAFRSLGEIYLEQKNYSDAKETFKHIIKLLEDEEVEEELAEAYFDLALVNQEEDSLDEASEALKKALKLNPNNPRYLDTMLEISIINKDKISALDAYEKLEKANPENNKLIEFKERIREL